MPVLSAVLTLRSDETRGATLAALREHPGATVGPIQGDRLPVVLESDSRDEDKKLWKWAAALPAVTHTELVFAEFSDLYLEWSRQ